MSVAYGTNQIMCCFSSLLLLFPYLWVYGLLIVISMFIRHVWFEGQITIRFSVRDFSSFKWTFSLRCTRFLIYYRDFQRFITSDLPLGLVGISLCYRSIVATEVGASPYPYVRTCFVFMIVVRGNEPSNVLLWFVVGLIDKKSRQISSTRLHYHLWGWMTITSIRARVYCFHLYRLLISLAPRRRSFFYQFLPSFFPSCLQNSQWRILMYCILSMSPVLSNLSLTNYNITIKDGNTDLFVFPRIW